MEFLTSPAGLGTIGGALSIVFFPYLQMARGKLVPRSALDDQIKEKEIWRQSATDKDAVIAQQSSQLGEYMETTRVARLTFEAVHGAATA